MLLVETSLGLKNPEYSTQSEEFLLGKGKSIAEPKIRAEFENTRDFAKSALKALRGE